ncbi:MAG: hypothetical protein IT439_06300 [Phycisphaerales bacterium]|nr:hypothetical protein [Phycisphaerales bacterium]
MKSVLGILAVAGIAAAAGASSSSAVVIGTASFVSKASMDPAGDADNITDSWIATGSGLVNAIRVTGQLTEVATGTYASEAKVRVSAGAGHAFSSVDATGTTTGNYTGTIAVGPTITNVTPFNLNSGGTINFEWFESFDDSANAADQTWDFVNYEFVSNTITNGGAALGTIGLGSQIVSQSQHVAGGLDFFTFDFAGVSGNNYLNLRTIPGASGGSMDTEMAIYDSNGLLVVLDDDGGAGLMSQLSFGATDPLASPDKTPGIDGVLAAGSYTIVTGGYNTTFGATLNDIVAGTASGDYALQVTYAPAPGALGTLGLAGLVAARRRRA